MRSVFAAVALCFSASAVAEDAMPETVPTLSFERVFASPGLDGQAPRQVKLSPDGRYLTLLRNRADDRDRYDLWGYDIETREWRMLVDSEKLGSGRELSEDEKMQRERARVAGLKGIISYQWESNGAGVLVPLDGQGGERNFQAPDWAPWTLLSVGAATILHFCQLPRMSHSQPHVR
jgi:dipeptidyl-peptidase-4